MHYRKAVCRYCGEQKGICVIKRHEESCKLNPENIRYCPVCSGIIKSSYKTQTCSYACSNSYFRSGPDNPNWKDDSYRTTCFYYHSHKCIICDETNIVEVHHFDEDKNNNQPDNLIPMCPTHHQYMHSRHKSLINDQVIAYRNDYLASAKEI